MLADSHPVTPLVDRWRSARPAMVVVHPVVTVRRRLGEGQRAAARAGVLGAAVGDVAVLEL